MSYAVLSIKLRRAKGETITVAIREPGPNRLGALYAAANFGVVDIDWPEHKITLALRDVDGNTQRSAILSLDELGPAR